MQVTTQSLASYGIERSTSLFNNVFSEYYFPLKHTISSFIEATNDLDLELKLSQIILVEKEAAGIAVVSKRENEGWLYSFGMLPEYRRHGLGKKFMRHVVQQCSQFGIERLGLEVLKCNLPAKRLYHKLSFSEVDELYSYSTGLPITINNKKTAGIEVAFKKLPIESLHFLGNSWDDKNTVWSRRWETLNKKNVQGIGCLRGDNLIGYVIYAAGDVLGINRLAVAPHYRQQGIGTALLKQAHLENPQCSKVTCINIKKKNYPARSFLKQLGFRVFIKQHYLQKTLQ